MSSDSEKASKRAESPSPIAESDGGNADGLHRRLNNRQVQLLSIGGTVGTGLFIGIGAGLAKGGPGSLLVCTALYAMVLGLTNNSIAEMNTYMPVSGGFIRLAGHWVDDALGFMVGWNFFFYEALLIPFEIVALNLVVSFWSDTVTDAGPTAGFIIAVIIAYGVLNLLAVGVFGEAEFWLALGKVLLIFILFMFTFVTMVGGNPQGDVYGFRYWSNVHDAFATFRTEGDLGRLEGFMGALASAAFFVTAFKTVYFRFGLFFIGAALTCGIVLSHTDETLVEVHLGTGSGHGTAAASPWVIAMSNLGIEGLPHLVNALLFTTIFSAGNTYTYCATRSLYSLALDGRAPAFLRKTTKNGIPIYCFAVTMVFPLLAFLQLDSSSAEALTILLALITGGGIVDYITMNITFLFYYRACKAQGIDRKKMPYFGYFQPYCAWIALILHTVVCYTYGYTSLAPFNAKNFFSNYTMQIIAPFMYLGWKLFKRTKIVSAKECDLVWERPVIDAYEERAMIVDPPTGFWEEIIGLVGIKKNKKKKNAAEVHV
ncbi:putative carnitine transport protein [Fusarium fujikuroi]|nr:putative carnitine transport protein [Fusarium fujikuroi]